MQAEVAQARADLQGREMQLDVKNYQTDQRGAQLEQGAMQNGEQSAAKIVQQAMQAVDQRIAGLEQAMSRQSQQPIVVPIPSSGGRRQVSVKRGKDGALMGMIEDLQDEV